MEAVADHGLAGRSSVNETEHEHLLDSARAPSG
jgi:hypothetical protein